LIAALAGALACGGLLFTLGTVLSLDAVHEDRPFTLLVDAITALGVIGGACLGVAVFRWLAAPSDTKRPPDT
jgi:hypothetical protein